MNKKLKKFKKYELSDSKKKKILGAGAGCDTIQSFNSSFDLCYDNGKRGDALTECIDFFCEIADDPDLYYT
ncbi:MAG: hypothetical protein AAFQ94_03705 [Bacteroidota bacterium]